MDSNVELRLIKALRTVLSPLEQEESQIIVSAVRDESEGTDLGADDIQIVTRLEGGTAAVYGLLLRSVFTVLVFSRDSNRAAEAAALVMKKPNITILNAQRIQNWEGTSTAVELDGLDDGDFTILAAEVAVTTRN